MEEKLAIIACCKMEELYIKEWLDWHFAIGVDHIILCDNNDYNYSPKLECVVRDYLDKGLITIYDYRGVHPIQPKCYDYVYQHECNKYDWFCIIDIDEFIEVPAYNNDIKKLLSLPHLHNSPYFSTYYKIYSDNNLLDYDNRDCQVRFTEVANTKYNPNGRSYSLKSFFRGKPSTYLNEYKRIEITNHHDPFWFLNIPRIDILNNIISNGNAFIPSLKYNCNEKKYFDTIYNICYVKHFPTKTIGEYIKYKIYRGDTLVKYDDRKYPYTLNRFFISNEFNQDKVDFVKNNYPDLYDRWDKNGFVDANNHSIHPL